MTHTRRFPEPNMPSKGFRLQRVIAHPVKTRERFMGIGQVLTMPLFFASNAIYPLSLQYCRVGLLQENYFHAVLEAMKSIAGRSVDCLVSMATEQTWHRLPSGFRARDNRFWR